MCLFAGWAAALCWYVQYTQTNVLHTNVH
jgi:hypothetical protein